MDMTTEVFLPSVLVVGLDQGFPDCYVELDGTTESHSVHICVLMMLPARRCVGHALAWQCDKSWDAFVSCAFRLRQINSMYICGIMHLSGQGIRDLDVLQELVGSIVTSTCPVNLCKRQADHCPTNTLF